MMTIAAKVLIDLPHLIGCEIDAFGGLFGREPLFSKRTGLGGQFPYVICTAAPYRRPTSVDRSSPKTGSPRPHRLHGGAE
jgi:hypothetical protein